MRRGRRSRGDDEESDAVIDLRDRLAPWDEIALIPIPDALEEHDERPRPRRRRPLRAEPLEPR